LRLSDAWLTQVESDYQAAQRVYAPDDHRTYCQAIAKHQQAVEKLVKATSALLAEGGIALPTDHSHHPAKFITRLRRLSYESRRAEQHRWISKTFSNQMSTDIKWICLLAPKLPDKRGDLLSRNTEYPFHHPDGTWRAPAEAGVFSPDEVERSSKIAWQLYIKVQKAVVLFRRSAL
jgi:hypothetical protein